MARSLASAVSGTRVSFPRRAMVLVGMLCMAAFLLFYNLGNAPPALNDEGFYLSVAKTIAIDGVYAARNADGYQTFGVTQSVGAPLILPIALSFKLFGVGLLQGRVVLALFALIVLALIYGAGHVLFGGRVATVAVLLLLGSGTSFLYASRQTMGEVPALGFFLAGWLAWAQAVRTRRKALYPAAGVLIGLAMITKNQYLIVGFGTLALLFIADLFYYRQGYAKALVTLGALAGACVAAWVGWQIAYFGPATFWADTQKLSQLASSTTGFRLRWTIEALQYLFGPGSNHFYFFWGLPALAYACVLCMRRNQESSILAFPVIFTIVWLASFVFWTVPWWRYALTPIFVSSIFVAKIWHDLADGFRLSASALRAELYQGKPARAVLTLVILAALAFTIGEPLQKAVRLNILAGNDAQHEVGLFLDKAVAPNVTIETWERELAILTNHRYHFPDLLNSASLLKETRDDALGVDYFRQHPAAYLVVGRFARSTNGYDMRYVAHAGCLLTTIGDGEDRYDIYRLWGASEPYSAPQREQAILCR